ncbi:hypothetical protein J514_0709 [Acinetobacter sp. 1396970]|uniref:hypothetical protein n=1 Tax=Acinetobacter sp. 1396970 TaxID=1310615 RepID=UPI00044CBEE4|nr:hypothetical protein [Acinetobacter sp. 1396970]EXB14775.1 hypothetical protein J514_0709 [Acinetobacter sp. 1396970]
MDKCREEFEKWLDDNNMFMNIERRFDQESNTYDYCAIRWIWESWQHQQAKVEELKATIKGNHGRIAELERLNRVKAQAIIDLHQEITELKASHHGEVIGHEVHFKKIKQERDELQTLYIQQGINMLKLQKRVDKALELMQKPVIVGEPTNYVCARFKELEQALKGEGQ